jgi:hypothetical protein
MGTENEAFKLTDGALNFISKKTHVAGIFS